MMFFYCFLIGSIKKTKESVFFFIVKHILRFDTKFFAIAIFLLVDNILLICSNGLNNHDLKLTYSSKADELMGQFL